MSTPRLEPAEEDDESKADDFPLANFDAVEGRPARAEDDTEGELVERMAAEDGADVDAECCLSWTMMGLCDRCAGEAGLATATAAAAVV